MVIPAHPQAVSSPNIELLDRKKSKKWFFLARV